MPMCARFMVLLIFFLSIAAVSGGMPIFKQPLRNIALYVCMYDLYMYLCMLCMYLCMYECMYAEYCAKEHK